MHTPYLSRGDAFWPFLTSFSRTPPCSLKLLQGGEGTSWDYAILVAGILPSPLSYRRMKTRRALEAKAQLYSSSLQYSYAHPLFLRFCNISRKPAMWQDADIARESSTLRRVTRDQEKRLSLFFLPLSLSWLTFMKEQTYLSPFSPHQHRSPGISLKVHLSLITLCWFLPRIPLTRSIRCLVSVDAFHGSLPEAWYQKGGSSLHVSEDVSVRHCITQIICDPVQNTILRCALFAKAWTNTPWRHTWKERLGREQWGIWGRRAWNGSCGGESGAWRKRSSLLNSLNYGYLFFWNFS